MKWNGSNQMPLPTYVLLPDLRVLRVEGFLLSTLRTEGHEESKME
jgi:hypothetical protein